MDVTAHLKAVPSVWRIGKMNETEFLTRASAIMDAVESQVDDWFENLDIDVEASRQGTSVLNLKFGNGRQVVINTQTPLREMWLAARRGGFHYRFDGQTWKDTRGGPDLDVALSEVCSEETGKTLRVNI